MSDKLPTEDCFARYREKEDSTMDKNTYKAFPLEGEKVVALINFKDTIICATDAGVYEKTDVGFSRISLKPRTVFQQQLAEFLDRQDVVKAITKAVESERYVDDIVKAVIAALKKEARKV